MGAQNGAAMFEWLVANGVENVLGSTLQERWKMHISRRGFRSQGGTLKGWFDGMWRKTKGKKEYRQYKKHFKMDTVNL
jgi:hypothetical protein